MLPEALVEFAGEAAEVFTGADDDGGLAHALGLDGGGDGTGGAAVDDEVVGLGGAGARAGEEEGGEGA